MKQSYPDKRKKSHFCVSRNTLCTQKFNFCMPKLFFGKFLSTKFDMRLKKKTKKFLSKFQNHLEKFLLSPSKKCLSYNLDIWNLYDYHFLAKSFSFLFCTINRLLNQKKKKFSVKIQQNKGNLYDFYFFIDWLYGIVWLVFVVYGVQPGSFLGVVFSSDQFRSLTSPFQTETLNTIWKILTL